MEIHIRDKEKIFSSPGLIADLFQGILAAEDEIDREKEHFWVLGLETNRTIKYAELVTLGILNYSIVHPREVFRLAIMKGVDAIVIVHNHPSGGNGFSGEDLIITQKLIQTGDIIGIKVLDHVLITKDSHRSFAEMEKLGRYCDRLIKKLDRAYRKKAKGKERRA